MPGANSLDPNDTPSDLAIHPI